MDNSAPMSEEKRVLWLRCCGDAVQKGYGGLLADDRRWSSGGASVEQRTLTALSILSA